LFKLSKRRKDRRNTTRQSTPSLKMGKSERKKLVTVVKPASKLGTFFLLSFKIKFCFISETFRRLFSIQPLKLHSSHFQHVSLTRLVFVFWFLFLLWLFVFSNASERYLLQAVGTKSMHTHLAGKVFIAILLYSNYIGVLTHQHISCRAH